MIDTISELLDFPVSLERTVDAKQEWKEIQTSNKMVFVKLQNIRDRQWLARHKALYFKGELTEWEEKQRDFTLSGDFTYAFCMPLFLAWYFYENGADLLDAIRASVLRHDKALDQVQKGRILIDKAARPHYHERPYGMFGPATPAIVRLFYEGEISDLYEKSVVYGDYISLSDRVALRGYLGAMSAVFYGVSEGVRWLPGRYRRGRAMLASHKPSTYMDEDVLYSISRLKESWALYLNGGRDYSESSETMMAIMEETDRQLREDIQSGALSGWVVEMLTKDINL